MDLGYTDGSMDRRGNEDVLYEAKLKVSMPSTLLLIAGILCLVLSSASAVLYSSGSTAEWVDWMNEFNRENIRSQHGEEAARDFDRKLEGQRSMQAWMMSGWLQIPGLILAGLMIFGALKLKKLQSKRWAMAGAIAGCIPMTSCCCIALPLGVWVLVVILDDTVKEGFALVAKGIDTGAFD